MTVGKYDITFLRQRQTFYKERKKRTNAKFSLPTPLRHIGGE
jgi:hypothetical protein